MNQDIVPELVKFAVDQCRTIGGWRGKFYVRDCLDLWREHYGDAVADAVAARVRAQIRGAQKGQR